MHKNVELMNDLHLIENKVSISFSIDEWYAGVLPLNMGTSRKERMGK